MARLAAGLWLAVLALPAGAQAPASGPSGAAPAAAPSTASPTPPATAATEPAAAQPTPDPRETFAAVQRAKDLFAKGQADEALAAIDEALAKAPRDPQLRFLKGVILADRKRVESAQEVFLALTQEFPELPEPHNNLAALYAAQGRLDEARAALENAIRALPTYALAHENLGDVHLRIAARSYDRAAQLDPRSAAARDKLGLARELILKVSPAAASPAMTNLPGSRN